MGSSRQLQKLVSRKSLGGGEMSQSMRYSESQDKISDSGSNRDSIKERKISDYQM